MKASKRLEYIDHQRSSYKQPWKPNTQAELPEPMVGAVHFSASRSLEYVGQTRSETLRSMVAKAKELSNAEWELKQTLSDRRREVLAQKRLLLFKWMLEQSGSTDVDLFQDLCKGFDLTGSLPESNTFAKKFRPAQLPTDALRSIANTAREALLTSTKGSGDHDLDVGVYEATLAECHKGFLVGPISADSLPDGATLTKRFGVLQKEKVRPIDDYRASLVNSSVTQVEAVSIHGVDHIAALCAEYMRQATRHGASPQLVSKCWDLASAYKQVPLSDSAFAMDSYLVVFNPSETKPEIYQQKVLPFGSIASVTAFLRCALALWHIGTVLLHFTWTSYFDDFLSVCDGRVSKHVDICTSLLFQLLGWKLSEDKLVPYDVCCKVLGIELDLTRSPAGMTVLSNTQARRAELTDFIDHVLHSNRLSRSDAERFRGRLQFASNYLFGRRFRNCLRELNSHISRGFATPSDEFKSVLLVLKDLLHDNLPRIVDTRFFEWVHLYVDASFEPGGSSGIGGLLLDQSGNCLGFFSESVSEDLVTQIKSDDQKTIIFELEGLAVAIGLSVFQKLIAGKRLIVFTDNQAVQACLIKCKSNSENMDLIIKHICRSEEKLNILAWIERVPSQSNPSDVLSREIVIHKWHKSRTTVDPFLVWQQCVRPNS